MKLNISVSIKVKKTPSLDHITGTTIKKAIKETFKERLKELPSAYIIEKIIVKEVEHR